MCTIIISAIIVLEPKCKLSNAKIINYLKNYKDEFENIYTNLSKF